MLNIAIVEDNVNDSTLLSTYLNQYAKEEGISFNIQVFDTGNKFIGNYTPTFDIVFMDIDLDLTNGLDVARELRKIDSAVLLVFVTNLAQFAINGYEVDAADYMLKPLKYPSFSLKVKKIISRCTQLDDKVISFKSGQVEKRVKRSSVIYVEINLHTITYHTEEGDFNSYGSMKQVVEMFPKEDFKLCNSCYLVNLRHVTSVDGFMVLVGKHKLSISHAKRKQFVESLHAYYKN